MAGEAGSGDDLALSSDDALRAALPATLAKARVVITPYPFVAGGGDYLRVISLNSLVGVTLEIHGRQAARGFEGTPFRFVHTPLPNRMPRTQDFPLNAGLVTNLSVYASAGSPLIGQTFVIIQLVRSVGAVAFVLGTLLQGDVTSVQSLGWPGSPIQSSIEGGGYIRTVVGTQPALGAEVNEVVPTGARWELLRFFDTFATNAVAGNRFIRLQFITSGQQSGVFPVATGQLGSTAQGYTWAGSLPSVTDPAGVYMASPMSTQALLLAGDSINTLTQNITAGDQWRAPQFVVREWLEGT